MYITDYSTKMELSEYESLSLIKLSLEKIQKYHRTMRPNMTKEENTSLRRMYTMLNTLDSHMERSKQWVTTGLMGWPYEYKSHQFCEFSVYQYTRWLESFVNDTEFTEKCVVQLINGNVATVSQRMDYEYRTDHITLRFQPNSADEQSMTVDSKVHFHIHTQS